MKTPSPEDKRRLALANLAGLHVRDLMARQIEAIEQAAADSIDEDSESEAPVIAKVSASIKWPAGAPEPKLTTKLSYTVRRSIETEDICDPNQIKIDFDLPGKPAAIAHNS